MQAFPGDSDGGRAGRCMLVHNNLLRTGCMYSSANVDSAAADPSTEHVVASLVGCQGRDAREHWPGRSGNKKPLSPLSSSCSHLVESEEVENRSLVVFDNSPAMSVTSDKKINSATLYAVE